MNRPIRKYIIVRMILYFICCLITCTSLCIAQDEFTNATLVTITRGDANLPKLEEVKYKDVPRSFLIEDAVGQLHIVDTLAHYGIKLNHGANARYSALTKTLTMVNTEEQHRLLTQAIADYKKKTPKKEGDIVDKLLNNGKLLSGKINEEAKKLVSFIVSEQDLVNAEAEASRYNWNRFYNGDKEAYKNWLKLNQAINKSKNIQAILIIQDDCEFNHVKKFAKMLKLKAPILEYDSKQIESIQIEYGERVFALERPNTRVQISSEF